MRNNIFIVALVCITMSASLHGQMRSSGYSSPATRYVADEVEKQSKIVAVYTDFGDGRNRFTQRAALNDKAINEPVMDETAPSPFGVSCIKITYPLAKDDWNGFIFMTGKLTNGTFNPQFDFGKINTGQDLRGAKSLKFKARGEKGGERVQFYMGGLASNDPTAPFPDTAEKHYNYNAFVSLSNEWRDYSIDLRGLDLSRIAGAFGWVTNQPENAGRSEIVFYLDEIVYEFDTERTAPLFLRSHEPMSLDKEEAFLNNFAYIYDNAIAAMALSYAGDYDRACRIADAFVYAAQNDRYYPPCVLRNAYFNGDPRSYPGWQSAQGKEFALIPGFYCTTYKEWWEDRYGVSINTGNLAWAILALAEVYQNVQKDDYLKVAMELGDYINDNFYSPDSEGGGYTGGYEGWEPSLSNPTPPNKLTYKSTEHAIDLYIAYKRLAEIAPDQTSIDRYKAASLHARRFVLSMYDPRGCFYTGTTNDGITINAANLPLDTNTWGILALWGDTEVAHLWDAEKVLDFINSNFKNEDGLGLSYSFNYKGSWMEGTAQHALVLCLLGKTDEYNKLMEWLNNQANDDGSMNAADRDNLRTGFDILIASSDDDAVDGMKSVPWVYNNRGALGATCWLAFAQQRTNPYATTTGNTFIDAPKAKIWSSKNGINIAALTTGEVRVYSFDGIMRKAFHINADETKTMLISPGFYVVTLNNSAYKVRVD